MSHYALEEKCGRFDFEHSIVRALNNFFETNDSVLQHLCTGLDIFVYQEPCLMCAAALVHSRMARVFFVEPSSNGAVKTSIKLQHLNGINHRYRVYQYLKV